LPTKARLGLLEVDASAAEGGSLLVPVDAIVGKVLTIAQVIYRQILQQKESRRFAYGAAQALTIGSGQLGITGYRHRSDYTDGAYHPDNLDGLAAVLHEAVRQAVRGNTLQEASTLELDTAESMLLVGGPVWDQMMRHIFGYQKELSQPGATAEARYECTGLARELPFRFDVDVDSIPSRASRFIRSPEGIVVEEEPNWGIIGRNGDRYYPTLRHDGFLATDYLVLTKVPNLLAHPTRGTERFFVNYAGTHGVALRAIRLMLCDHALVRRVVEDLRIDVDRVSTWPGAYQVVLRVGGIRHSPRAGSTPGDVRLVQAVRVDESPAWWDEWRRRLAGSLGPGAGPPGHTHNTGR
jgi:hypothetical protein